MKKIPSFSDLPAGDYYRLVLIICKYKAGQGERGRAMKMLLPGGGDSKVAVLL